MSAAKSPGPLSPGRRRAAPLLDTFEAFLSQVKRGCGDAGDPHAALASAVKCASEAAVARRVPTPLQLACDWLPRCCDALESSPGFTARAARKAVRVLCIRPPLFLPAAVCGGPDETRRFLRDIEMQFLLRLSLSHLGRGKVDPLPQREVGALRALLEAASFPLEAPHVDCEPSRRRRSTDSNDVAYASLRAFFDSAVRMPLSEHAPETLRKLEAAFEFKTVVNAKGDTSDEGKRSPGDDGAPNANIEKGLARAGSLGGRSSPPPEPQEAPRRFARSSSSSSANGSARSLSSSSAGALAAAAKRERAEPAARAAAAEAEAVAKRLAESAAAADALQRVQKARPVRGGSAPMVPQCSPQKRKSTGNAAAPSPSPLRARARKEPERKRPSAAERRAESKRAKEEHGGDDEVAAPAAAAPTASLLRIDETPPKPPPKLEDRLAGIQHRPARIAGRNLGF